MSKQVTIGAKPNLSAPPADDWVLRRRAASDTTDHLPSDDTPASSPPLKRLTIDVSADLHARIKSQCAQRGAKMNDEIRALLQQHFPPDPTA